ncbi:hypothetical protein JCM3770_003951 [Rhodotorula araucariae]
MQHPAPTNTFVFKEVDGLEINADIFLPTTPSRAPLPILVWFHGGGLLMSARSNIGVHLRRAASKYNIAVVCPDYRLAPQAPITDIVEDVKDAIAWSRLKLPKLVGNVKLDSDRFIVGGHSAGTDGRIITHEEMACHVDPEAPVRSYSVPASFPPPPGDRGLLYLYMVQEAIFEKLLFGKVPKVNMDDFIPAKFWSKDMPPTYVFHGQIDNRVGIEQSHSLVEAFKAVGATYEYEECPAPGGQHLFDHFDASVELESMYSFIMKYF